VGWPEQADELLGGPRGRRTCFEVVSPFRGDEDQIESYPAWRDVCFTLAGAPADKLVRELTSLAAGADSAVHGSDADGRLLLALAQATDSAMYWQPPDKVDDALADPAVYGVLVPVARALSIAHAARWWSGPLDRDRQQFIEFVFDGEQGSEEPPDLVGAAAGLDAWRETTLDDERESVSRPSDPAANYSGNWWSTPNVTGIFSTTRSLTRRGPAGLRLVEDSMGWQEAVCWPVEPLADARVLEVRGPADWAALVARYPLEVTRSRWHDWFKVTGRAGTWVIPDYPKVASEYDAIHLSVGGYLTTAGRKVPVEGDEACSVLAGWSPDETYWLADVLEVAGPAVHWRSTDGGPLDWTPSAH
jgi:hypothetical protein